MNIRDYAVNLEQKDGIFFSRDTRDISYPEEGNELCYQIEGNSFWFAHRNACIIEAVKKHAPETLFFDIGGGNGFVARGLEDQQIETVLIEPGLQGALNARKRGLSHIVCATLEDAGFREASLPAAGLFDVVEHIEDDLAFMRSLHSFMEDQGKVFITVPAFQLLWSHEDVIAGHYRRYTTRSINALLKQAGFEVLYSSYIFSILPLPVFLFRTLPGLLGLGKKSGKEKYEGEHAPRKGILNAMLNAIWNWERRMISKGRRIPVGGSCFVVAQKK